MSVANKLLQAAAGNAGGAVYVDDVFSTFLYEGTGSSLAIDNGVDLDGEGGLIWSKRRDSTARTHILVDSVRGATKVLNSDGNYAEYTMSNMPSSFNSNGYTIGTSDAGVNNSGDSYVSWTFRKQEKFFDIVTYTGNGTAGRTISHNLNSVPGMIIVKRTSATENWNSYHRAIDSSSPENYFIDLDRSAGRDTLTGAWNNTAPTSTVFTVGDHDRVNASGHTYVAYLFAHNEQDFGEDSDEAIIHCGSYNSTGLVNLGFEPQFILSRCSTTGANWKINDMMRGISGGATSEGAYLTNTLSANTTAAEENSTMDLTLEPNGFNVHSLQDGSGTYIYVAIARSHKPASEFAATDLFAVDEADNSDSKEPKFRTTFPVDFAIDNWATQNGSDKHVSSRLMQGKYLRANGSNAQSTESSYQFDYMNGFYADSGATSGMYAWMFRRAKGFFDVVTYTTTPSSYAQTDVVTHNLGVTPELIIVKNRSGSGNIWMTYNSVSGVNKYLQLETNNAIATGTWSFPSAPTATQFTTGFAYPSGTSAIAYLFATVAGISKVGSYTGTGSDLNVDCGFSAGARFILIKRTDSTGDWYVYDSIRGIVAGNDPYTLLNTTAVQVTNTDYIDPLSSGFTVTSSAPAALNASSGTYIFLAIA